MREEDHELGGGWDSVARLVAGRWVVRRPRRPDVVPQLRRETRLMPWLAPRLPLPVPVPEVVSEEPFAVRHALVPGEPLTHPAHGRELGSFLRALHDCPADEAVRLGVPTRPPGDGPARFEAEVLPLLPAELHPAARALLAAGRRLTGDALVHGDLGPEHVLTDGDALTGVIDFGDAHVGDPAIDLAWALHGTPRAFADDLAEAYGVTGDERARALTWHRLGPWHHVTFGLDRGDPSIVREGLAGVVERLAA
ncbi:aminoglycoside phosphotransferase family protein [Actinosynnema sp. NPDC053489]|uniref:aminoglycoside phosphotransferase family protein n=1 Tax=Actinosynnema sp. NPDC053489 TaxID=3363916 RepID=UPI0037CC1206